MGKNREPTTYYYESENQDFVRSARQDAALPADFRWIHKNPLYRLASAGLYGLAVVFAFFYTRLALHVRVVNRQALGRCGKKGCFIYGNHTQPVGDAFTPAALCFPRRICTVAGTANLGIPVLGPLLPMLGGLFIPNTVGQMREFMEAVAYYAGKGRCIILYPEAHVWPYCTFIRSFPDTAFRYPVQCGAPALAMTATYQKRRFGRRPRLTLYLDGPFYPDPEKSPREQRRQLHDAVYDAMVRRSAASDYAYIRYQRREEP